MPYTTAVATDVGRSRDVNEDAACSLTLPDDGGGYEGVAVGVADGMGGHEAGDVASETAIEAFEATLKEAFGAVNEGEDPIEAVETVLERAYARAHQAILDEPTSDDRMGTTLVTAVVQDDQAVVGNVGDSRAYRVTDDAIEQVTEDHSLVRELVDEGTIDEDEMADHRLRNVVTQSLGQDDPVEPDLYTVDVETATLLLCSDGLTEEVSDTTIATIVRSATSATDAVTALVDRANDHGGNDNITAAVVWHAPD